MINSINERTLLNNGTFMPWLGLGLYKMTDAQEIDRAVKTALEVGYRAFDTATFYRNERFIGKALRQSGIPRDEIFLTSKVWNDAQREKRTLAVFNESLEDLGTDYVDLYLIHWPVRGYFKGTWQVLEKLYGEGRTRAIGTSNFHVHHLQDLMADSQVLPAVDQVEFHPYLYQSDLLEFCRSKNIQLEAWGPLMKGNITAKQPIAVLAEKYKRTPAQIALRWDLQHEVVVIPKSSRPERILENSQIFDFELSPEDMSLLDGLNEGLHLGPNPDTFNF
jgi:diketogulonate reductase-like aldo/keto reductase